MSKDIDSNKPVKPPSVKDKSTESTSQSYISNEPLLELMNSAFEDGKISNELKGKLEYSLATQTRGGLDSTLVVINHMSSILEEKISSTRENLEGKISSINKSLEAKISSISKSLEDKDSNTRESLEEKISSTGKILEEKISSTGKVLEEKISSTDKILGDKISSLENKLESIDSSLKDTGSKLDNIIGSDIVIKKFMYIIASAIAVGVVGGLLKLFLI